MLPLYSQLSIISSLDLPATTSMQAFSCAAEELLEVVTWQQLGFHSKPIGVLNINGYYDHLLALVDHGVQEVRLLSVPLSSRYNDLLMQVSITNLANQISDIHWAADFQSHAHYGIDPSCHGMQGFLGADKRQIIVDSNSPGELLDKLLAYQGMV